MVKTIPITTRFVLCDEETYTPSELLHIFEYGVKVMDGLNEVVFMFDMDNTVVRLNDKDKKILDSLHLPGAYRHLPAIEPARFFVQALGDIVGWKNIGFVSHCCPKNVDGSTKDKKARIKELFPEVRDNMIIVAAAGTPKSEMIRDAFQVDDLSDFILFDDYWPNLNQFVQEGGNAIRVTNGRNAFRSKNWTGMQLDVK